MTLQWALFTLLQCGLLRVTQQSIAGVTYMDDFDFEERYRDVNECNPFYWHPLHMPEDCANMYEKLIRSRIAKNTPVRIFRNKEKNARPREEQDYKGDGYMFEDAEYGYPIYELASQEMLERRSLSPYEKMLNMVQKDVMEAPGAPSVQLLPGLGPVAVYRQPISSKTELMIKQIATDYAKAGQDIFVDYAPYFPYTQQYPEQNGGNKSIITTENVKKEKKGHKKNKENIKKKNLANEGVITFITSKRRQHKTKPQ